MSIILTDQDKITLYTAAHGAVMLVAYAGVTSAGRVSKAGSLALYSATGLVGHVLAKQPKGMNLNSKSAAGLADQVLPALTATMSLLKQQAPAEADNFRRTVIVAVEAATRAHRGEPSPPIADMTRKITAALNAA